MNKRPHPVALFCLIAVIGFASYMVFRPSTYQLFAIVRPVGDMDLPVIVYVDGREVGRVQAVRPMTADSVFLLTLGIQRGEKIPADGKATYRKVALGIAHLDIGLGKTGQFMQPQDTLYTNVETGPFYEINIDQPNH